MQFSKHYTRSEARALLPQIRKWLRDLRNLRQQVFSADQQMTKLLAEGKDLGGELVHDWLEQLVALKEILAEFQNREIQVKDIDRGLVDFPSIIGGKEVFLCWEQDEEDVEFWHDLTTGFAGRERLHPE